MRHLCAAIVLLSFLSPALAGPGFELGFSDCTEKGKSEPSLRMWVFKSGESRLSIVALDQPRITEEDGKELGCSMEDTLLVATGRSKDPSFEPEVWFPILEKSARGKLRPVELRFGRVSLRGLVKNRYDEAEPVDELLAVVEARDREGATVALFLFLPVDRPPVGIRAAVRKALGGEFPVLCLPGAGADQTLTGTFEELAAKMREALESARGLDPEWGVGALSLEGFPPASSTLMPWESPAQLVTLGDLVIGTVPGRMTADAGLKYRTDLYRDMGNEEPPAVLLVCRANGDNGLFASRRQMRSAYRLNLAPSGVYPSEEAPGFAPPRVETEPLSASTRRNPFAVERVWMDSRLPSGSPSNDRFPVEHYVPEGEARGAIIVLPIWRGGVLLAERVVAAHLARRGYEVAIMPLPWQFQRAPRGVKSGKWTVSSDLERTKAAMEQAQADVRLLTDWLQTRPGIGEGRVGVLGISLGAHVAAGAYQLDDRLRAAVVVMAGGDPASMVWEASKETRGIKRDLVAKGVTLEKLREMLKPLDPASVAGPWPYPGFPRYRGVLMINGTQDRVIPPVNARVLHEALGRPEIVWFDVNHYSMAEKIDEVLALTDRHLDRLFD